MPTRHRYVLTGKSFPYDRIGYYQILDFQFEAITDHDRDFISDDIVYDFWSIPDFFPLREAIHFVKAGLSELSVSQKDNEHFVVTPIVGLKDGFCLSLSAIDDSDNILVTYDATGWHFCDRYAEIAKRYYFPLHCHRIN